MIGINSPQFRNFVASTNHTTIAQRAGLNTLLKSGSTVQAVKLPKPSFSLLGGNKQLSITRG